MDDEKIIIARIGIDSDGDPLIPEPVFITLSSFKGKKYLDVRKHYAKDGDWMPTKKGLTFGLDQFKDLKKIIDEKSDEIVKWLD